MSPLVNAALAVVALVLAGVALVLATLANRRWVAAGGARRGIDPLPSEPALDPLRSDPAPDPAPDPLDPDPAHTDAQVALADRVDALGQWSDGTQATLADLAGDLAAVAAQVEVVTGHVEAIAAQSRAHSEALAQADAERAADADRAAIATDPSALRHVALVRYDAFADVGGRLSYSVALLDDTRSGLVLTTLAGKADVRTYARTVSAGRAEGTLTAEEQQAIEAAVGRVS